MCAPGDCPASESAVRYAGYSRTFRRAQERCRLRKIPRIWAPARGSKPVAGPAVEKGSSAEDSRFRSRHDGAGNCARRERGTREIGRRSIVMPLSGYAFSALREGELTLYRGSGDGLDPILLVAPVAEEPRL